MFEQVIVMRIFRDHGFWTQMCGMYRKFGKEPVGDTGDHFEVEAGHRLLETAFGAFNQSPSG